MDVAGVRESLNAPLLDKARSSIQEFILVGMLDPENEVVVILRNVKNYLLNDCVTFRKTRTFSSATVRTSNLAE
jgi:hypothetical protein